jgi:hypothetical protein
MRLADEVQQPFETVSRGQLRINVELFRWPC